MDGDDPYVDGLRTSIDSTRMDQDMEDLPLSEFFRRPIKVFTASWSAGTVSSTFNPWSLYFENKRVVNRINNYNLLRATLKVKFVISGNAFYFGRMIAAYKPYLPGVSFPLDNYGNKLDCILLSQMPHVYLNPATSQGGIITCPFFWNRNAISIPAAQWQDMGDIFLVAMNQLGHVSDPGFANIQINAFVWAEDVQLSVPTATNTSMLIPQAGEIDQANSTGMISGPATSIARVANALANIPYLTPYAKATELALSTIATIASRFGYCRPTITRSPEPMRPSCIGSLALTNVPDNSNKLSVDHKQEATIDPRIAGIEEEDMLAIVNIAKRESLWQTFNWDSSANVGTLLWNGRVQPTVWGIGGDGAYYFPATAMASLPFKYWTGTLNYRMQVVCSGLHKGRLAFCWDPIDMKTVLEPNIVYTEIVDIAETADVTFSISNGQTSTLLRHATPGITPTNQLSFPLPLSGPAGFGNGSIGIYVMNRLTSPNPSQIPPNITINIFISAGDDFKVFVPDDHFQNFVMTSAVTGARPALSDVPSDEEKLEPQAGEVGPLTGTNCADESAPEKPCMEAVYTAKSADMTNLVFTGESIPSFRGLLKRYSAWKSIIPNPADASAACANFKLGIFPYHRGRYASACDLTADGDTYAYCNELLVHYVTSAFAGFRGNMRYKVIPRNPNVTLFPDGFNLHIDEPLLSVERFSSEPNNTEFEQPYRFGMPVFFEEYAASRSIIRQIATEHTQDYTLTGANGMAWVDTGIVGALEFEVPWYCAYRFAGTRHLGWAAADTWGLGGFYLYLRGYFGPTDVYDIHVATGEDFQTYFFVGLPRLFYEPTPPNAEG